MKALLNRIVLVSFILTLFYSPLHSQTLSSGEPTIEHVKNKLMLYNIGFGFFNGAIGLLINEKKPTWKEILLNGGLQGACGGYLIHLGKTFIYKHSVSGKLTDYWISNSLFSAGNSVIVNASFNKRFYESITFDYLFTRINIDIMNRRLGVGLNISELLSNAVYRLNHQGEVVLDFRSTMQYGVFISHPKNPETMKGVRGKNTSMGGIHLNLTRIEPELYHRVLSHELVHYYQDLQYQVYSNWLNEFVKKEEFLTRREKKSGPTKKIYIFAELFGPLVHDALAYPLADIFAHPDDYYSNLFEKEARYYSRGGM